MPDRSQKQEQRLDLWLKGSSSMVVRAWWQVLRLRLAKARAFAQDDEFVGVWRRTVERFSIPHPLQSAQRVGHPEWERGLGFGSDDAQHSAGVAVLGAVGEVLSAAVFEAGAGSAFADYADAGL